MDKNPKNRYQSAAQMLRHLRRLKLDENTLFNITKPAQRTPTSETKIKETTIHSGEDKRNSEFEIEERPPAPTHKNPVRNHRVPTPPPDTKTSKLGEQNLPTERYKIGSDPLPSTRTTHKTHSSQAHAQNAPKQTGKPKASQPSAPKNKRKKKGLSSTTILIIIIICLLIAIAVAISLLNSIGNHGGETVFYAPKNEMQNILLYLRQAIL
jgi:hypothetical protein